MADFIREDLKRSRFEDVDLTDAHFRDVDLTSARFHMVDLTGVTIRGALMVDAEISGEIGSLRVNGVDVAPLVEAELDRLHPERPKMRPTDAAGFREAWDILEELWRGTVDRARGMTPDQLHERVDDEWSFVETVRHLVFATDAWVNRAVLGVDRPFHPLDLPHDEMRDIPEVPRDREARPALDEVLEIRANRRATVRRVLETLTDEQLDTMTEPVSGPGYPEEGSFEVRECLLIVLNEEWWHRQFAERDLHALEDRPS